MSNIRDDAQETIAVNDESVVDRSCISCDNCGVGAPQKCCSRCGTYYYCRYVGVLNISLYYYCLKNRAHPIISHHKRTILHTAKSAKCNIGNNISQIAP